MKNLVIIKLGGSVITDKTATRPVFRKKVVERIAREIKTAQEKNGFNLILVHGAGSFGHPYAKKYKLHKGYLGPESAIGTALTKSACLELNFLVIRELVKAGIKACDVDTSSVAVTNKGKIKKFDTSIIKRFLSKNIVPVLSGNVVLDGLNGIAILSGDQITSYLAKKLKAKNVIFASDVDGIFHKNPKIYKDAKLIGEINNKNYSSIIKGMRLGNSFDVTGEMRGKILAIKRDLSGGKIMLINGLKRENMLKSLVNSNGRNIGTVFKF